MKDDETLRKQREYQKEYRLRNLEKSREQERKRAASGRNASREAYNAYMREWGAKNKERLNEARRKRLKTDPKYAEKQREKDRERYANNPLSRRNTSIKTKYGITLDTYNSMYESQNGKCAICEGSFESGSRRGLVIDHCHTEGNVRRLLCRQCNTGLGQFKDSVSLLEKAIKYLKG